MGSGGATGIVGGGGGGGPSMGLGGLKGGPKAPKMFACSLDRSAGVSWSRLEVAFLPSLWLDMVLKLRRSINEVYSTGSNNFSALLGKED